MGSRTTSRPGIQNPPWLGSPLKCHTPGIRLLTNTFYFLYLRPLPSLYPLPQCPSQFSSQQTPAPPGLHYPLCFPRTHWDTLNSLSESSKTESTSSYLRARSGLPPPHCLVCPPAHPARPEGNCSGCCPLSSPRGRCMCHGLRAPRFPSPGSSADGAAEGRGSVHRGPPTHAHQGVQAKARNFGTKEKALRSV